MMGKKLPYTPNSIIRSALHKVWLRSRERAAALKRTGYCCEECGAKQSRAKGKEQVIEVHHADRRPNWDRIIRVVREELLQTPEALEPLCPACHDAEHSIE